MNTDSKKEYIDAKWHPISTPPRNSTTVMLWRDDKGHVCDEYMLRAFYQFSKGIWYDTINKKEITPEELSKYKWWLEINPPKDSRHVNPKVNQRRNAPFNIK